MPGPKRSKTILSASRRTDIPAFYMDWFMAGIAKGSFEVTNPFNHNRRQIPARPQDIHSIVFWSKNFGPFLDGDFDRRLQQRGYRLFFNFTINAAHPKLEPHVPPLNERLRQMGALARRHDPESITWRFDPLCFVRGNHGAVSPAEVLAPLQTIADPLADMGIRRCVTSFVDLYQKIRNRLPAAHLELVDPPLAVKCETLLAMAKILAPKNISLGACCEKSVLEALPPDAGIYAGNCIPGPLLARLYGADITLKKDPGQRRNSGCTCNVAVDIGSYHQHPCYHNCLFCYANPQEPNRQHRQGKRR
jgi:hypothetical protein